MSDERHDLLTLADAREEEANHERALSLQPLIPNALDLLYQSLGDRSWRVRKAALVALDRFREEPRLVDTLIAGLGSSDNAGLRNACAEGLAMVGARAVPALTTALQTFDLDQRKFVVEALGIIGTKEALDALLRALEQDDPNVRAAVVDALGMIGGSTVISELTHRLEAQPGELQYALYLLDALARCKAQLQWPTLSPWLTHKQLARFVYPLLGMSKDPASIPALIKAVATGTRNTRRLAIVALATLWKALGHGIDANLTNQLRTEPQMMPALTAALQDDDVAVVEASVRLFALCKATDMMPEILRVCSARGLEHVGIETATRQGPDVVMPLLSHVDRVDIQSQLLFLDAIESAGNAQAVPALIGMIDADSLHVASGAVRVIGNLGGPEVIEPLMNVVRERDENELIRQAMFALIHAGGRHADAVGEHVRRALQMGDVQAAWFRVLGSLRRASDVDMIASGARHRDHHVRRAAVEAAQRMGSLVPEPVIIASLTDESAHVRSAAARALSAYRSEESLSALIEAMHDLDPWVVAEAAESLGAQGGRRALQTLQQAAGSAIAPVAIAVLQSLARLDSDDLDAWVRKSLAHSEPEVVREALKVSASLGDDFAAEVLGKALNHSAWDVRSAAVDLLIASPHAADAAKVSDAFEAETEVLVRDKLAKLRAALRSPR